MTTSGKSALEVRLDIQRIAIREVLEVLAPAQCEHFADRFKARVSDHLTDLLLSDDADAAAAAEVGSILG